MCEINDIETLLAMIVILRENLLYLFGKDQERCFTNADSFDLRIKCNRPKCSQLADDQTIYVAYYSAESIQTFHMAGPTKAVEEVPTQRGVLVVPSTKGPRSYVLPPRIEWETTRITKGLPTSRSGSRLLVSRFLLSACL